MDHAEKIALLRRTRLLETLPEEQLKRLLGSCREVSLVPGEALCHEGEVGRAMYVVLSGNLVVSREASRSRWAGPETASERWR